MQSAQSLHYQLTNAWDIMDYINAIEKVFCQIVQLMWIFSDSTAHICIVKNKTNILSVETSE